MTREWRAGSDTGLGMALGAVILAAVGAGAMAVGAAASLAGWGFAIAMVAGAIGIWAVHAFPR